MAETSWNLKEETGIQVQEAPRVPNKMNTNRSVSRHIIIKAANVKDKETILQAGREKQPATREPHKLTFSAETVQVRREWHDTAKVLKEKIL